MTDGRTRCREKMQRKKRQKVSEGEKYFSLSLPDDGAVETSEKRRTGREVPGIGDRKGREKEGGGKEEPGNWKRVEGEER